MSKKLSFWSVFAIVTGSQIGSGVFMLPASLAPYGHYSIYGWLISAIGAICLAMVFSGLCQRYPHTGGPHVYVKAIFGNELAFFTGWTYWVISWVSTAAVVIASISYLSPFIGSQPPYVYFVLEVGLLFAITGLNLKGIHSAGRAEFVLTVLKLIPLALLPLMIIGYFDINHIQMTPKIAHQTVTDNLSHVVLLTLWGFIGLETATTPAGSVENPSKTIPKAIVAGTIATALLYIFNSISIMGVLPNDILIHSKAPYVDACHYLFGGHWHLWIAMIASIVCIGTLNAWMLASGQIVLGLAEDQLMPAIFSYKNKDDAPEIGIMVSCLGIIPLLYLTLNANISQQITDIIDFSVVAFLFVYFLCVIAFIKQLIIEQASLKHWLYALLALFFCIWTIMQTAWSTVATSMIFSLSGVPVYLLWYRKRSPQIKLESAL